MILAVLSVLFGCTLAIEAARVYFKRKELLSTSTFLVGLSIVDVFLPALLYAISGKHMDYPSYFGTIDVEDIIITIVVFFISLVVFLRSHDYFMDRVGRSIRLKVVAITVVPRRVYIMVALFMLAVSIQFLKEYAYFGNWDAFYEYKITRTYLLVVPTNNILEKVLFIVSTQAPTMLTMCTAIAYYYKNMHSSFRRTWILIAVMTTAVVLASLYRGAIINIFIALMVILEIQTEHSDCGPAKRSRVHKKIIATALFGGGAFLVFGGVRSSLTSIRWGEEGFSFLQSVFNMIKDTVGVSLFSCARIVHYLRSGGNLFFGQSYFERFYQFIPRQIWAGKPLSYGVQSINKALGTPPSTMDAVTFPGEALANFGFVWLPVMIVFGALFVAIELLRRSRRYSPCYAAIIFPIITTTFWMGFTGYSQQLFFLPLFLLACHFMIRYTNINDLDNIEISEE